MSISRRTLLRSTAAGMVLGALPSRSSPAADPPPARCSMGIVEYAFAIHRQAWRQDKKAKVDDPLRFLQEAHRLGAGGIQAAIPDVGAGQLAALRKFAEQNALHIEANISPPREAADVARFETLVQIAKSAGASLARTVIIPGRRYEQFKSLQEFRDAEKLGEKMLQLAEPILSKHGFRLAVENHKDQRIGERLALLKRLSSEFIGACVDMGNSFTLLEDPMEVVKALAPWAFTVHIKDQAARENADGFDYADAALGTGFLNLAAMVEILRKAKPAIRFNLEVITRDALKVPVLTEGFWATFPDVPASDMARTLRMVRAHASAAPFPAISRLPPQDQVAAERAAVEQSLRYARERLGL